MKQRELQLKVKKVVCRAVVVAQLVEQFLSVPEIRNSNPKFGKIYLPIVDLNRQDKNKDKRPGLAHLKKRLGKTWPNRPDHFTSSRTYKNSSYSIVD